MPNVCIIVLNYRTADLTIGCLRSLAAERAANVNVKVVVVDNASNDSSVQHLRAAIETEGWRDWATVREQKTNGGFAVGNNAALRDALQETPPLDFFWLLNSDTQVRAGALAALCACMDAHPTVGLAGSRLEHTEGIVQRSAFRFPTILGELENGLRWGVASRLLARWMTAPLAPNSETRVEWVAGASLFVRRALFESIGLLDEQFFMYFDDVDVCKRAQSAGWECWYVPSSRVIHLVGQSSGIHAAQPARRPAYWFAARRHYFLKHHSRLYAALADAAWLLGFGVWRLRRVLQRKPDPDPPQLWRDFLHSSIWLSRQPHLPSRG